MPTFIKLTTQSDLPAADEAKKEIAELEKRLKLPQKKAHGDVNSINWVVSGTLNDLYTERKKGNPKLQAGGLLRMRVRKSPTSRAGKRPDLASNCESR